MAKCENFKGSQMAKSKKARQLYAYTSMYAIYKNTEANISFTSYLADVCRGLAQLEAARLRDSAARQQPTQGINAGRRMQTKKLIILII